MQYVKCLNNQTYFKNDLAETFEPHLLVGKVYRVAPPLPNDDPAMIRIFDGSYGEPGSESATYIREHTLKRLISI